MTRLSKAVQHRARSQVLAALRALALFATLLFAAGAQADPVETERLMQDVRSQRAMLELNLLQAYADMDSGQTAAAVAGFAAARADTAALSSLLDEVGAQIRDSRVQGQYTNAQALEIARVVCINAKRSIDHVESYLAQMQVAPSPIGRALIDAQLPRFDSYLQQLERELARSQA